MLTYLYVALFKVNPFNTAFVLLAPTLIAKQVLNQNIDQRIENMWRTHKNRVDRGLGATYQGSGNHLGMK